MWDFKALLRYFLSIILFIYILNVAPSQSSSPYLPITSERMLPPSLLSLTKVSTFWGALNLYSIRLILSPWGQIRESFVTSVPGALNQTVVYALWLMI